MIQIERFPYTPELGWSVTRYEAFSTCRRQYYYQYYRKSDREYPLARIDLLRALSSVPLEIGNLVHDTVAELLRRLLKSDAAIDPARFAAFVERRVIDAVAAKTFREVYYGERPLVTVADLLPAVQESLDAFLGSPRFTWIQGEAGADKEDWLIEPEGYGEARIEGMKVYCKVDFLFLVQGRAVILDWKTGKEDPAKHGKQLLGYRTWAMHHLHLPADRIDAVLAYLRPAYREVTIPVNPEDVNAFAARIRAETEEMRACCADPVQNLPRAKGDFPLTDALAICRQCNFRELCGR
ncbi:MAG: PD-(D/E)XK nuclease family protein [Candidatus Latescibacterota bacterium]|jgi:hypothetical protein